MKFRHLICEDAHNILLEDKVVKFDGQTFPKFGWCVIMCGGPGSGKSTVEKNLVPINAKIYNSDSLKEYVVKRGEIVDNELIFNGEHFSLDGVPEPYDLSNPEYSNFLHHTLKPKNRKLKRQLFGMGNNVTEDRLPNLIFDMTGSEIDDFESIIFQLNEMGYKFSVVFVLNDLETALENNRNRARRVKKREVVQLFTNVMRTILNLFTRSDLLHYIRDFWVVFSVKFDIHTPEGKVKYIKSDNVKRLDFDSPDDVYNQVYDEITKQMKLGMDAFRKIDSGEDTELY